MFFYFGRLLAMLQYMEVSWNRGTPKSSIYRWISNYKPSIWGYPHDYGNKHIYESHLSKPSHICYFTSHIPIYCNAFWHNPHQPMCSQGVSGITAGQISSHPHHRKAMGDGLKSALSQDLWHLKVWKCWKAPWFWTYLTYYKHLTDPKMMIIFLKHFWFWCVALNFQAESVSKTCAGFAQLPDHSIWNLLLSSLLNYARTLVKLLQESRQKGKPCSLSESLVRISWNIN